MEKLGWELKRLDFYLEEACIQFNEISRKRQRQKILRKLGCEKIKRMNAKYIIRPGEQLNKRGVILLFIFYLFLSFLNH